MFFSEEEKGGRSIWCDLPMFGGKEQTKINLGKLKVVLGRRWKAMLRGRLLSGRPRAGQGTVCPKSQIRTEGTKPVLCCLDSYFL